MAITGYAGISMSGHSAAAVFVFLPAAAGARFVAADLWN